MVNEELNQQRLVEIERLRARARALMSAGDLHESVHARVMKAVRDLDEAVVWLKHQPTLADVTIGLARDTLDFLDEALRTHGRGSMFL